MSNSLTADEKRHLLALLRRVDDPEALHHLLGDVGTQAALQFQMAAEGLESEFSGSEEALAMGFEPVQAMNDASKRRLVAENENFGYGAAAKQMPRPPSLAASATQSPVPETSSVPGDVVDLDDWGTTIMLEGKFGNLQKSYYELASDRSPEVVRYCIWLEKALTDKMKPQFHDLVAYLKTARALRPEIFDPAGSSGVGFVRVRKQT